MFCMLSKFFFDFDFFPGEATWGGEKTKQEDDYEDASFEVTSWFWDDDVKDDKEQDATTINHL